MSGLRLVKPDLLKVTQSIKCQAPDLNADLFDSKTLFIV